MHTTGKLMGLKHFTIVTDFVHQEFRQDVASMTVLCSSMSENSAVKTRTLVGAPEQGMESPVGSFTYISSSWAGGTW